MEDDTVGGAEVLDQDPDPPLTTTAAVDVQPTEGLQRSTSAHSTPGETALATDSRPRSPSRAPRSKVGMRVSWRPPFLKKHKDQNRSSLPKSDWYAASGTTTPSTLSGTRGSGSSPPTITSSLTSNPEASSPLRTVLPSILNTSALLENAAKHAGQAKDLQSSKKYLQKVVWASDDRKLILDKIQEIRIGNNDLESLLQYRPVGTIFDALEVRDGTIPVPNLAEIQTSIMRLHEALASLNMASTEGPIRCSIQLRADCKDIADQLPEEDDLSLLRPDSNIFLLHIHGLSKPEDAHLAVEVLAETPSNTQTSSPPTSCEPLRSLHDLRQILVDSPAGDNFKRLGTIARTATPLEVHQLFSTHEREWQSFTDLNLTLDREEFCNRLSPVQRLKFASLIAIAHVYFAKIRVSCDRITPSNFVYYAPHAQPAEWSDCEPFVLNPYLSFGFGSRKPLKSLGGASGVPALKNSVVAELGLLMYQVGSSSKVSYGQGLEGFRRAKERAIDGIHAVEVGIGARYAEATLMCLEWAPMSSHMSAGEEDWRVIQGIIGFLEDFGNKLEIH